jgi:predicted membrane protein
MNEIFYKNPLILVYPLDNFLQFIPSNEMQTHEIVNSIMRFFILFSIILTVIKSDPKFLLLVIPIAGLLYLLTDFMKKEDFTLINDLQKKLSKNRNNMRNKEFRKSTKENPFGNFIYSGTSDYENEKGKEMLYYGNDSPEARKIKKDIEENFIQGIPRSDYNLYDENLNLYPFRTLPHTKGGSPSVLDSPHFYKEMLVGNYNPKSMQGRYEFDRRDSSDLY